MRRRFCSKKCAWPNEKTIVKTEEDCPICGDRFVKVESNDKNLRKSTCGKLKCQKSRKNHPQYSLCKPHTVDCSGCGKSFLKSAKNFRTHISKGNKRHFCSAQCYKSSVMLETDLKHKAELIALGVDPLSYKICCTCKLPKPILEFTRTVKNRSNCKKCHSTYCCERWRKKKIWAVAYLGGKCLDCGYDKHWIAFDFHHRDPAEKEFDWHKLKLKSPENMKKELDKCDLLCAICHRIRHSTIVVGD